LKQRVLIVDIGVKTETSNKLYYHQTIVFDNHFVIYGVIRLLII